MKKLNSKNQRPQAKKKSGFTLVEMIIYTSIFGIIFTIILQLFIQVNLTGARVRAANELQENASQFMNSAIKTVREGDSLNSGASTFDSHPGSLVIANTETMVLDTYSKNISIGGQTISIRKLQLTEGANDPIDLTSDHVDVTNYVLTDMSPSGHPGVVQIELELSTINPQNDLNYDQDISVRTTAAIRKET